MSKVSEVFQSNNAGSTDQMIAMIEISLEGSEKAKAIALGMCLNYFMAKRELSKTRSNSGKKAHEAKQNGGKTEAKSKQNGGKIEANHDAKFQQNTQQNSTINKPINKENQLRENGHINPGNAFADNMDGRPHEIVEHFKTAYREKYRKDPVVTGVDYAKIRENLAGIEMDDLKKAFGVFMTDGWCTEKKLHTIGHFCKDPAKWVNAINEAESEDDRDIRLTREWMQKNRPQVK